MTTFKDELEKMLIELESHFAIPSITAQQAHIDVLTSIINLVDKEVPERKDWSVEPSDEWENAAWVGYNQAIDDMRAKLMGADNEDK